MWPKILDRVSHVSLFIIIILLPVFFLPFTKIPVEVSKSLLVVIGLCISIIFWTLARFFDGKISFPRSPIILGGLTVVLAVLLSAIFSTARAVSFFGTIFDLGTFWFMLAAFLLMFISSVLVRDNKNAQMLLFGVILSSVVVMVFQVFRFIFPDVLSLGVLGGRTENLIGSFNALGILAGFSCLTSLFIIEFFSITKIAKFIFGALILISLFLIACVNFPLVWKLLGITALLIFVYKLSFFGEARKESKINFPAFSFAIVIISLLFFMSGQFIGGYLPSRLSLSNTEVSPSLGATVKVAKEAWKRDPVFGIGPNRFGEIWSQYKPQSINQSIFWDVSFNSGSGLIPTFMATTGTLGILAWLIFFALFLLAGVKSVFTSVRHNTHREMASFFILALYLFIASFFYSPGPVIFLLAFAFTGVFVGLLSGTDKGAVNVSFLDDHRKSFFFILAMVLAMVLSAGIAFKYIERLASVSYFSKALSAQSVPAAETSIGKALSLHVTDLYMRSYAQIYLIKMNTLLNKNSSLTEAEKSELQASFDQAINGATAAVQYNPGNYLNYQTLGNVYSAAGVLGQKDAYPRAIDAYQKASALNPFNPGIKLALSRAYLAEGKTKEAKDYANTALSLKADYIDALLMLSQIAKKEGNSVSALEYAQRALSLAPANKDLLEYVNSLKGGEVKSKK